MQFFHCKIFCPHNLVQSGVPWWYAGVKSLFMYHQGKSQVKVTPVWLESKTLTAVTTTVLYDIRLTSVWQALVYTIYAQLLTCIYVIICNHLGLQPIDDSRPVASDNHWVTIGYHDR